MTPKSIRLTGGPTYPQVVFPDSFGEEIIPPRLEVDDLNVAYERNKGNTLALFGHSIINYNKTYDQTGAPPNNWGRGDGFYTWMQVFLRRRFTLKGIFGHDGYTVAQLKNQTAEVIASGANYVMCFWGINSVYQGVSSASIKADAQNIIDQFHAAGMTVIMCTDWPATTLTTTAQKTVRQDVNAWITSKAADPGIIVIPWHHVITDPTAGGPLTGALADGTHPFTLGAQLAGKVAADILAPIIPALGSGALIESNVELNNMLTNGMFTGTTGTKSGAGATGTVATGYQGEVTSASHAATFSKVARTDGRGEWQQIQVTAGTAGTGMGTKLTKTIAVPAGWESSTIYLEIEVETDADFTNATTCEFWLTGYTTAMGAITQSTTALRAASGSDTKRTAFNGIVRTPNLVLLPTTANILFQLGLNGPASGTTSTIRVGRARIGKL